ncbi:MAG: DUF4149 domain-containing protein [Candidatus Sericytochromatia bacterium]|nr:DUF4149 domain-containing protein [Candidatus Sericytochromatia bacterium]
MNNNKINSAINIFSFIPMSIVTFGVLSLGLFVAPTVFREITPRPMASNLMADIFTKFFLVAFICALITLFSEMIRFILLKKDILNKIWYAQIGSVILVTFLIGYSNFQIAPKINQMRIEQKGPTLWTNTDFVSLHKQSEAFAKAAFLFGLIPLVIMVSFQYKKEQS